MPTSWSFFKLLCRCMGCSVAFHGPQAGVKIRTDFLSLTLCHFSVLGKVPALCNREVTVADPTEPGSTAVCACSHLPCVHPAPCPALGARLTWGQSLSSGTPPRSQLLPLPFAVGTSLKGSVAAHPCGRELVTLELRLTSGSENGTLPRNGTDPAEAGEAVGDGGRKQGSVCEGRRCPGTWGHLCLPGHTDAG